jgi:hypothetical protein
MKISKGDFGAIGLLLTLFPLILYFIIPSLLFKWNVMTKEQLLGQWIKTFTEKWLISLIGYYAILHYKILPYFNLKVREE